MVSKESSIRISLIDLLYGIVLAYGFNYFESAHTFTGYFRFFFSYLIIIIDWIYVHQLYWGKDYKSNILLILDIGVIFSISRLLLNSSNESPLFFLWLSILFGFFSLWVLFSKKFILSEYDWKFLFLGDMFACTFYFGIWLCPVHNLFLFNIALIIIYLIAFSTWFKKVPLKRENMSIEEVV